MNDGVNLYLAVEHGRPELDGAINLAFDNNHNGSGYEEGDDVLIVNSFGFYDMFVSRQPPCDPGYTCIRIQDTAVGGTSEDAGPGAHGDSRLLRAQSSPRHGGQRARLQPALWQTCQLPVVRPRL